MKKIIALVLAVICLICVCAPMAFAVETNLNNKFTNALDPIFFRSINNKITNFGEFAAEYTRGCLPSSAETRVDIDKYISVFYYDATIFETELIKHFNCTPDELKTCIGTSVDTCSREYGAFYDSSREAYGFAYGGGKGDFVITGHTGYIKNGNNSYDFYIEYGNADEDDLVEQPSGVENYDWMKFEGPGGKISYSTIKYDCYLLKLEYDGFDIKFISFEPVSAFPTDDNFITSDMTDADCNGWVSDSNNWYYYTDGEKMTGWVKDNGKWYYMASDGVMKTGWVLDADKWYYMNSNGAMQTGWQKVNGTWYYMDGSGAMKTGWLAYVGKSYYLASSGAMLTGWLKYGGNWYHFASSGAMDVGWIKDGTKWYYTTSKGIMVTGKRTIGEKNYLFNSSGAMQTGWVKDGNKWYYYESNGAMHYGWLQDGGKWYYLIPGNGNMVTGTLKVDGKVYKFNSSGAWIG